MVGGKVGFSLDTNQQWTSATCRHTFSRKVFTLENQCKGTFLPRHLKDYFDEMIIMCTAAIPIAVSLVQLTHGTVNRDVSRASV